MHAGISYQGAYKDYVKKGVSLPMSKTVNDAGSLKDAPFQHAARSSSQLKLVIFFVKGNVSYLKNTVYQDCVHFVNIQHSKRVKKSFGVVKRMSLERYKVIGLM
jgi:hypothetical protein